MSFPSRFPCSHLSNSSLLCMTIHLFSVCLLCIFSTKLQHLLQGYTGDNNNCNSDNNNNKPLRFFDFNLLDVSFIL